MPEKHDDGVLPLVEERLHISKEKRETGRVQISTQTETVDSLLPIELSSLEVDVVRVPIDRRIDRVPEIVTEGDLTIIPVVEERVVVTRELYLREEIHVRRVEHRETTEIPVSTRRQTARVERLVPEEPGRDAAFQNPKDDQDDL